MLQQDRILVPLALQVLILVEVRAVALLVLRVTALVTISLQAVSLLAEVAVLVLQHGDQRRLVVFVSKHGHLLEQTLLAQVAVTL